MADFYHFKDGKKIDDQEINQWVREVFEKLNTDESWYYIHSGDTMVSGAKHEDGSIFISVSNSSGLSTLNFFPSIHKKPTIMRFYKRP